MHLRYRDKFNLDSFWLKDESLEDTANLPAFDIIAQEIVRFPSVWIDAYRRKRSNRAVRTNRTMLVALALVLTATAATLVPMRSWALGSSTKAKRSSRPAQPK